MKKILVLLILICSISFAQEKILFVTGEYFPYSTEITKDKGIFVELVREAAKRLNVQIEIKFYPWKRCEELVKKGEAFATFPYLVTEERQKDFYFSSEVIKSYGKFFYMKEKLKNPKWTDYDSLKKFTIGGSLGYWYEKQFKDYGLKVDYSPTDEISLKKLYLGRVDLLPIDELVGWGLIKTNYPKETDKFAVMEKSLNESGLCLMISKKYKNSVLLKEDFDKVLKQIKDDGTFEKILSKYLKN